MEIIKKLETTLNTDKGKVLLTWIRTDNLIQFKPYFQVYGIIFNDIGEILLIQEKGKWKIPGGTPKDNETAIETLKRELLEEADVQVTDILPLGVQKIDYPNNPNKAEGDLYFQYRFVCLVDKLLDPTPDPDTGIINPRMFVPSKKITEHVKWGEVGKAMFGDAIKLFEDKIKR